MVALEQVAFALILPAIGAGVDALSGVAYAAPSRVHVVLEAHPSTGPEARGGLQPMTTGAIMTPPRLTPRR